MTHAGLTLYFSRNLNPRVAVAVAKYLGAPVDYVPASPRHPAHEEAFRPINPNRLVPVLVENGKSLWEADAIAYRLAQLTRPDFWPGHPHAAEITMWVSWGALHLNRPGSSFYFHRLVRPQFSAEEPAEAFMDGEMRQFREGAAVLNDYLAGRKWLVDDTLTYADFRAASLFPFAKGAGLPLADYPNILRWHGQLNELDAWRDPFAGLAEHPDQIKPLEGATS
ncbi:MAG: glutathione S-transferase family protein [Hyphomonas sp.]|nr:glutathione S-transferase family protein [Hyphomonas sp.]MCB9971002.1 glutathione S-transferase family protein [Hyphomonas sp.]